MKKLNKKSQLYIITALFLVSLIFLLSVKQTKLRPSDNEFTPLFSNFITEAKHVVNSAIYLNRNISEDFNNFASDYTSFAESNGINAFMFYAIVYEDNIFLGNKLNEPVNITTSTINFILTKDNRSTVAKKNWLNAEIDGIDYLFNTSMNITEIKIVSKMFYENRSEVRTYG